MSLVKCKECGSQVSDKAKSCPSCGVKIKRLSLFAKIGIGLLAFYILGHLIASNSTKPPILDVPSSVTGADNSSNASPWKYETTKDEMTGNEVTLASTKSINSQDLHWPYGPNVTALLMIRKHPRYGKDVFLTLTKGQILCHSYENCSILIRFDENKPEKYAAIGPSDNSSDQVFIRNYEKFVSNVKKSKTVRIELPMYQDGNMAWNFNVADFNWK